jgi:hypothetical protein
MAVSENKQSICRRFSDLIKYWTFDTNNRKDRLKIFEYRYWFELNTFNQARSLPQICGIQSGKSRGVMRVGVQVWELALAALRKILWRRRSQIET